MSLKTVWNHFRRNLPFLISCGANVVLCASKIIRVDFFWLLVGLAFFGLSLSSVDLRLEKRTQRADSPVAVVTVLVQFMLLYRFYSYFRTGQVAESIRANGISPDILFFTVGLILSGIGIPSMYVLVKGLGRALLPFWTVFRGMIRPFVILSLVYVIGISAIVRANYYYVDDLGRTLLGYQLTGDFSRFLASFFSIFLHGNGWLTDISPLSQWVAALVMAFASVLLLYVITEKTEHNLWTVAALIPFGLCPYFLQCYSYKFDAPYMALSVLAAIAPLMYRYRHPVKFGLASFAGTLIVCVTYQASSGILPMLVVMLAFLMWIRQKDWKEICVFLISSAMGYVAGMLVFRCILMVPIVSYNYVSASISLSSLLPNLKQYATLILTQFDELWLALIGVIMAAFVYLSVRDSGQRKIATLFAAVVTMLLMAAVAFGPYVVFTNPTFAPRGMYGIGVFFAVLCILVADKLNITKVAVAALAWLFFVFSFTYGNALHIQDEYTEFRLKQVMTDLNHIETLKEKNDVIVQVQGTVGYAPAVENMIAEYGILEDLVTVQFRDSEWSWGDYKLVYYYGMDFLEKAFGRDLTELDLPVLADTVYHTVCGDEGHVLIVLK